MTIDTDKTLELLHNSPCSFSYNTNPSRYTIEQKELVKFVNFIYSRAIDDFAEKLNAKCNGMIKDKQNSNVAPISWAEAYADFKDDIEEIAEQLKERNNE